MQQKIPLATSWRRSLFTALYAAILASLLAVSPSHIFAADTEVDPIQQKIDEKCGEDKQCALMVLANPSILTQGLEAAVRGIKIETLEFRESNSHRTEIEQKEEKCKELASRCWTDTASCERAKEMVVSQDVV